MAVGNDNIALKHIQNQLIIARYPFIKENMTREWISPIFKKKVSGVEGGGAWFCLNKDRWVEFKNDLRKGG